MFKTNKLINTYLYLQAQQDLEMRIALLMEKISPVHQHSQSTTGVGNNKVIYNHRFWVKTIGNKL